MNFIKFLSYFKVHEYFSNLKLFSRFITEAEEECKNSHEFESYEYHQCVCNYDYPGQPSRRTNNYKFKHCLIASDKLKESNFENYIYISFAVGAAIIGIVVLICSYKWYIQTRKNPLKGCCSCLCCCKRKKNETNDGNDSWTAVRVNSDKSETPVDRTVEEEPQSSSVCMKFCMSDPVQDCCEFFDCDIMWRKKSIYMIPIFGRKKPGPLQRRPTRPAPPPPPKPVVPPIVKHPESLADDFGDCDPVPEAPPSPEPMRAVQSKAQSKGMYVDPFSFLQRPFLKSKDKTDDEPDPLYSRMKDFVLGKVKKSASMASLNKLGVSANPDGSVTQNGSAKKSNKYAKTASLASLHDISDTELDKSYSNKRSQSLASLHMYDEGPEVHYSRNPNVEYLNAAGCRMSMDVDDVPPAARKDEYIDLEEMSKRMAAKMEAQNGAAQSNIPQSPPQSPTAPPSSSWTPNFIPASAFPQNSYNQNPSFSTFQQSPTNTSHPSYPAQYYPPEPAAGGRPPVPARTAVGSPIPTPVSTLGRPKPVVPPRPIQADMSRHSPKPRAPPPPPPGHSSQRSFPSPSVVRGGSNVIKPSGPPPPPPCHDVPIESSI